MNWHERYTQQAAWTHDLRSYIFGKAGLASARRILEVGCGSGAVLKDLPATSGSIHGLDRDRNALNECSRHMPAAILACGDARALPYTGGTFDITFCHFLLLWLHDPLAALIEMRRVTRPAGHIIAFAEPDYTARDDAPRELVPLGELQNGALRAQGVALDRGAHLAGLFEEAGIRLLETGRIRRASAAVQPEADRSEWAVLESDLQGFISPEEIRRWHERDRRARSRGERRLDVPTYFAWGQV